MDDGKPTMTLYTHREHFLAAKGRRYWMKYQRARRLHKWYAVAGFLVGVATVCFNLWIGG